MKGITLFLSGNHRSITLLGRFCDCIKIQKENILLFIGNYWCLCAILCFLMFIDKTNHYLSVRVILAFKTMFNRFTLKPVMPPINIKTYCKQFWPIDSFSFIWLIKIEWAKTSHIWNKIYLGVISPNKSKSKHQGKDLLNLK